MTDIMCTLSADDARGRRDEYARLLAAAYDGRERFADGMQWRLRPGPGVAEWARDLAAREHACCAFLEIAVTETDDRVLWTMTTGDDSAARGVVDLFYDLPGAEPARGVVSR